MGIPAPFTHIVPSVNANVPQQNTVGPRRRAPVAASKTNKPRVASIVLLIAVLGLFVGVLVAMLKHDWNLGAGIGGAVFGFAAVLERVLVLLYV